MAATKCCDITITILHVDYSQALKNGKRKFTIQSKLWQKATSDSVWTGEDDVIHLFPL